MIRTRLAEFRFVSLPGLVPGVALALMIATTATLISRKVALPGISPLILAILLGMVIGHLITVPAIARPGLAFSQRVLLRGAIVLLGLQITIGQILQLGLDGVLILIIVTIVTFLVTTLVGRLLGIDARLVQLIAAGTAICGASAIAAVNSIARDSEANVAYAIACITLFGTLALLSYPAIATLVGLSPESHAFWAGASLHEVGQVMAAANPADPVNEVALLAKLARVLLLIPMVLVLGYFVAREDRLAETDTGTGSKVSAPWFIFGFALMSLVATLDILPDGVTQSLSLLSQIMLGAALAAMGLAANMRELATRGVRPLLLAGIATIFIMAFSLALAGWAFS